MVDAVDSKSIAERRAGSSPAWGTNIEFTPGVDDLSSDRSDAHRIGGVARRRRAQSKDKPPGPAQNGSIIRGTLLRAVRDAPARPLSDPTHLLRPRRRRGRGPAGVRRA